MAEYLVGMFRKGRLKSIRILSSGVNQVRHRLQSMWTKMQCNNPSLTILGIPTVSCSFFLVEHWALNVENYSFPKLRAGSPENGSTWNMRFRTLETIIFRWTMWVLGPWAPPSCSSTLEKAWMGKFEDGNVSMGIRIVNSTIKGMGFSDETGLNG